MKNKVFHFLLIFLAFITIASPVFATTTKVDSFESTDDDYWSVFGANERTGQSFTASETYDLTQVDFKIYKTGADHDFTLFIYDADENGYPTGSAIGSATISSSGMTTNTAGEWFSIPFSVPVYLIEGNQYVMIGYFPDGAIGNRVWYRADSSSPTYTGGVFTWTSDGGSTWENDKVPDSDVLFKTYKTDATPPTTGDYPFLAGKIGTDEIYLSTTTLDFLNSQNQFSLVLLGVIIFLLTTQVVLKIYD